MKTIVILGSARQGGDTAKVVDHILKQTNWDMVDINEINISQYDYEHKNKGDDYLPLMKRIISDYDTILIATPVYWYNMSGIMKMFFDRFSDLLTIEKDMGRKLRGKNMAALSCSVGDNLGDSFWLPIKETAKYLGMNYLGDLHAVVDDEGKLLTDNQQIKNFISIIN